MNGPSCLFLLSSCKCPACIRAMQNAKWESSGRPLAQLVERASLAAEARG